MEQTLKTTIYRYPRRRAVKVFYEAQVRRAKAAFRGGALSLGAMSLVGNASASTYKVCQDVPVAKKYHPRKRGPHYLGPTVPEMLRYPLATTVWMEARNQPREGRRAVAHTIVNRVHADKNRWGHGLLGVVTQRKQFSCHNLYTKVLVRGHHKVKVLVIDVNRQAFFEMLRMPEDSPQKKLWRDIQEMSARVWSGQDPDNSGGATFYATTAITPYWRYDMKVVGIQYDHAFFREATAKERAQARRDRAANQRAAALRAHKAHHPVIKHHVKITPRPKPAAHGSSAHHVPAGHHGH